ncbi:MAG: hypothetical protein HQK83_06605 [Fibrobacteria bacterium]|nr:hypothetical protein [Fibrobacteria bacterium]
MLSSKINFCTFFDHYFLPKALAHLESISAVDPSATMYVLCLDEEAKNILLQENIQKCKIISLDELEDFDSELRAVKENRTQIEYYFTLKPSLMRYCLFHFPHCGILFYIDIDTFFYSSPDDILVELGSGSILLTPHNFSSTYRTHEKYGKFNAGFIGVKKDNSGLHFLEWWRARCLEWCYDRLEDGKFGDQKYLESVPSLFPETVICKNRAINLSTYSLDNALLSEVSGQMMLNNKPVIFFHFHGLKKVSSKLYDLQLGDSKLYKCKALISFYHKYINRLEYFQKKHQLSLKSIRNIFPDNQGAGWRLALYKPLFLKLVFFGLVFDLRTFHKLRKRIASRFT